MQAEIPGVPAFKLQDVAKSMLTVACYALFALGMLLYNSLYAFEIYSRNIVFLLMIQVKPYGFTCFCGVVRVFVCEFLGKDWQ